jgi:hypothetical protein
VAQRSLVRLCAVGTNSNNFHDHQQDQHLLWMEQMNTVWILIALVNSGHFDGYSVVPTLEFKTQQSCLNAIEVFGQDSCNISIKI